LPAPCRCSARACSSRCFSLVACCTLDAALSCCCRNTPHRCSPPCCLLPLRRSCSLPPPSPEACCASRLRAGRGQRQELLPPAQRQRWPGHPTQVWRPKLQTRTEPRANRKPTKPTKPKHYGRKLEQINRPEGRRREGPPFPANPWYKVSNFHHKILTLGEGGRRGKPKRRRGQGGDGNK